MRAMAGVLVAVLVLSLAQGAFNVQLSNLKQLFSLLFPQEDHVCQTDACISTAGKLLASIDESVDPCENFYAFACNGWIKDHPIPPTSISWNQFSVVNEKLDMRLHKLLSEGIREDDEEMVKATKMIYEACMDEERIEEKGVQPLLDLLDDVNGWPLLSPGIWNGNVQWQETAILVSKKVGISPVLNVGVEVDLRNTSRNIITISQPSPSTPLYFFNDPEFIHEYRNYLTRIVYTLRKERIFSTSSHYVRRQIRQMIAFENVLGILTKQKEEMKILDKLHRRTSIKQLQKWTNKVIPYTRSSPIDWKAYIQSLVGKNETDINEDTEVVVYDWKFLKEFLEVIDTVDPETIVNFIVWEVVQTMGRETNKKMRRMDFKFKMTVSGLEQDIPRWQECVHAANELGFPVGYLYVKKYFSDEAKAKAIEMVENIRREFRKELSQATWIDEETKKAALDKADFMNHFIGYPNWYGNDTGLNSYYKGLRIGRDHFANMIAIRQFLIGNYFGKLDERTNRDEWITGPAHINAFYDPRMNSIIFPAGILESPFFNKDQPEALNYGSIGSIIGHEITHAFDDLGRQSDKFGNINQWWTKETEETYLKNAKCFVEEYAEFKFPSLENITQEKLRLSGLLTLGENIADNGGLAISLKAYLQHYKGVKLVLPGLEKYSAEQLFYLGFATTWCETTTDQSLLGEILDGSHSPHEVRVLGSVSNSKHFANTWGCAPGSEMNPIKKCKLW